MLLCLPLRPSPKTVLDPPTYETFSLPPLCSRPVIFFRGDGHRPDESHFLRPPKLVLEGVLYSTFPPPKSHDTVSPPLCEFPMFQQFPRVTNIGSLPPKTLRKSRGPPQNRAEPRRALGETPAEPSETQRPPQSPLRQISSESLAEGCAPRMVTLLNFRRCKGLLTEI